MPGYTDRLKITTVNGENVREQLDTLVNQTAFALELNGDIVVSSVCSPGDIPSLAYGYMITQGYLAWDEEPVPLEKKGNTVFVKMKRTEIPELSPVLSDYTTDPRAVFSQTSEFAGTGAVFKETGASHSAAISTSDSILCFMEDVSRSAAMEKVIGEAYLKGLEVDHSMIILSSRIPVDFVRKAARAGLSLISAVSAPTAQAVNEAQRLGICLCGFVRGKRMNVYSSKWRLGL